MMSRREEGGAKGEKEPVPKTVSSQVPVPEKGDDAEAPLTGLAGWRRARWGFEEEGGRSRGLSGGRSYAMGRHVEGCD